LHKGIISLIRSAIENRPAILPEFFDWNEAIKIVESHGIAAVICYGAYNSQIQLPSAIYTRLKQMTYEAVVIDEFQTEEILRLFQELTAQNIDYMPLKGVLLKRLYPNSEMRLMGDADVLIRLNQYSLISKIMERLGYSEILESDHEFKWTKPPYMVIELHKRLIPSYNKDYYAYYGDGWQLAHLLSSDDSRFEMTAEDGFIYMITHFVKHYRNGGIGIKHLIDFQVFYNKYPELNQLYIRNELEKLDLYQFYRNISETLQVWFFDAVPTKMSDHITEHIFLSGAFGRPDNTLLASALKGMKTGEKTANHKRKALIRNILLPYSLMKTKYKLLDILPFLLPVFWIWRVLTVLLLHGDKVKRLRKDYEYVNDKNVEQFKNDLHYVGLDFRFNNKNNDNM